MSALPENTPLAAFHDFAPRVEDFREHVLWGLAQPRKTLSSKFLYDEQGSEIFERICTLPEYYVTRTELALMRAIGPALAAAVGPGASVIEFGSGTSDKIRLLLDTLPQVAEYIPLDISRDHLLTQSLSLAADHPTVRVMPVCADFTAPLTLPAGTVTGRPLGFFPGSTIGNLTPEGAVGFLAHVRGLLGADGRLVIGVDLHKDRDRLLAAYDDSQGVTADFNLNLLRRINRELEGDFNLDAFRHRARFNEEHGRMEAHLESLAAQAVTVADRRFAFAAGETIHTENSYKYTVAGFQAVAAEAGWTPRHVWVDDEGLFSIHLLDGAAC